MIRRHEHGPDRRFRSSGCHCWTVWVRAKPVKRLLPSVKLVFLTMNQDPDLATEAFRRGVSAYLLKTCTSTELMSALRKVPEGFSYLSPAPKPVDQQERLTNRQREVSLVAS
jgi:DNA-binding NarL/FixJ family response regulator